MVTTLIAGDLVTGRIRQRNIPARSGGVEVVLNGAGTISGSVRLPVTDPTVIDPVTGAAAVIPIATDLGEGRSFLGYVQDGKLLNAGPIWSSSYDGDSQVWSLSAAGLRSYFDYRFVLPLLNDFDTSSTPVGKTVAFNASTRTIAKQLVQLAQSATGGNVPVDFEADIAGSDTRTFTGETLKTVGAALDDIVAAGLDVMFQPYITDDGQFVRWRLMTGNPELRQAGTPHVWDTSAPTPTATSVSVNRSATTLLTTAYEFGATLDSTPDGVNVVSTLLARKRHDGYLISLGYPRLESAGQYNDEVSASNLQVYADGDVAAGRFLTTTLTFKARIDLAPKLADVNAGDYATLVVKGHPLLGSARMDVRILSVAASLADSSASIQVAPLRTAAA